MLLNFAIEIDIQTEENPIVTRFLERWKTRVEKERERRARAESIRYPVSTIHFGLEIRASGATRTRGSRTVPPTRRESLFRLTRGYNKARRAASKLLLVQDLVSLVLGHDTGPIRPDVQIHAERLRR